MQRLFIIFILIGLFVFGCSGSEDKLTAEPTSVQSSQQASSHSTSTTATYPDDWQWPQWGQNAYHTNQASFTGPHEELEIKWSVSLPGSDTGVRFKAGTQPVIDNNGNIFVVTDDQKVHSYSSAGTKLWTLAPGYIYKPATGLSLGPNNTLFWQSEDSNYDTGYLVCVDSTTGTLNSGDWSPKLVGKPAYCQEPLIDPDGDVYVSTFTGAWTDTDETVGSVKKFSSTGILLWTLEQTDPDWQRQGRFAGLCYANDKIYVQLPKTSGDCDRDQEGNHRDNCFSLNKATGAIEDSIYMRDQYYWSNARTMVLPTSQHSFLYNSQRSSIQATEVEWCGMPIVGYTDRFEDLILGTTGLLGDEGIVGHGWPCMLTDVNSEGEHSEILFISPGIFAGSPSDDTLGLTGYKYVDVNEPGEDPDQAYCHGYNSEQIDPAFVWPLDVGFGVVSDSDGYAYFCTSYEKTLYVLSPQINTQYPTYELFDKKLVLNNEIITSPVLGMHEGDPRIYLVTTNGDLVSIGMRFNELSGTVCLNESWYDGSSWHIGTPLENALVTLSGSTDDGTTVSQATTTDADGCYTFSVVNGVYTITPSYGQIEFSPETRSVVVYHEDFNELSFLEQKQTVEPSFTVSGYVHTEYIYDPLDPGYQPVSGVEVELDGMDAYGEHVSLIGITDEDGMFYFDNIINGTYIVKCVPDLEPPTILTYSPSEASVIVYDSNPTILDFEQQASIQF